MNATNDLVEIKEQEIPTHKEAQEEQASELSEKQSNELEEGVPPEPSFSKQGAQQPSLLKKLFTRIKHSTSTALVIAKKEMLMIIRYPWEIIFWTLMPLMWLVPFVFQGQALLGETLESSIFAQWTGSADVLSFIFIGALLANILDSAIWGAGNALRWEQHSGTLQYLWLAPISRIDLLVGASLGSTVWSLIEIILQFSVLSIFASWQVTFVDVLMTLLILMLVIIGLYGFSFAFAAIILVFKEPGVLTEFVDSTLYTCSPIRYPAQALPVWVRWIAWIFPFSWGLMAIRALFLTEGSIVSMLYMVGILVALDILFWVFGYVLFAIAERRTLKTGQLGAF